MRLLHFCAVLALFTGCGSDEHDLEVDLTATMPEQIVMAEAVTSLIANEIGVLSGPPTPGALVVQSCHKTECETESGGGIRMIKQSLGCATTYGKLDGSSYMIVSGVPELRGCATTSGPASFSSWPPSGGQARISVGQSSLGLMSVRESPPPNTLDRYEGTDRFIRHWGATTLSFNGSAVTRVEMRHWFYQVDKTSGEIQGYYHAQTDEPIALRMDRFWDMYPRIYNGAFQFEDRAKNIKSRVQLENLTYRKDLCCHPVSGSITATPDLGGMTSTFILKFSKRACGQARLTDALGRTRQVALPPCSS